ncbi:heparan-alpha-glucosaminide N-acetyltransferase domain-containing protein [Leucobacter sp. wl10]|uniref:heparan-alpha-glucosaminide N-acetyltransferase domain-containing protein n=1 Tax=Leucobacter sp. wl10 TaxID=2304677 RepID=UPI0013C2C108|nr:heparan-alpha-glucosaminide N-acetyltransferase domain-containing protein [Leucobacter sp. wl10]
MSTISTTARYYSLDAARGFALFAMVIAHTGPFLKPAPMIIAYPESILNDVAAPLFMLSIGVTATIAGPPIGADAGDRRRYRLQTAVRAVILIALGFLLEFAPSGVNIVLDYIGVAMLLALPFLFARTRTLLIWAAALIAIGPGLVTWLRGLAVTVPELVYPTTPVTIALDWIALGHGYQALAFLPILLIGLVLGRTILRNRAAMFVLFHASVVAFIPIELWRILDLPGTGIRGGYVEVLRELPLALGAFALIALLTDLGPDRLVTGARRVFEPLSVQGRLGLSIYALHVLVLMGIWAARNASASSGAVTWFSWPRGAAIQIGLVVFCWLFAAAWWRWLGPGPIERVVGVVSGRHPLSSLTSSAHHRSTNAVRGPGTTSGASNRVK